MNSCLVVVFTTMHYTRRILCSFTKPIKWPHLPTTAYFPDTCSCMSPIV